MRHGEGGWRWSSALKVHVCVSRLDCSASSFSELPFIQKTLYSRRAGERETPNASQERQWQLAYIYILNAFIELFMQRISDSSSNVVLYHLQRTLKARTKTPFAIMP